LSESSDISEKLKSQEEAIAAFDAYRKQVNRTLLELEEKLDELQLKIQDSQ
jgi:phage-related tail protein